MSNVTYVLPYQPLYQQAAGADPEIAYDAADFRTLIGAMWDTQGPIKRAHFAISERGAGANWSIDIAAGLCVIDAANSQEKYLTRLAATVNVPITGINTAPAAPRTHKVYAVIYDKFIAGTLYNVSIFIGEDTGSGAPVPTSNPIGYVELGTFTISPAQVSIQNVHITNHLITAGLDPDWTTLTLFGGFTASNPSMPPAWRRVGKRIELRGLIQKSVPPIVQAQNLLTLPTAARPTQPYRIPCALNLSGSGAPRIGFLYIPISGTIAVHYTPASSGSDPAFVSLDGAVFDID